MKTTVELPDDVLRKAREQAEQEGVDLEHFISGLISKVVMAATVANASPVRPSRVTLPLIKSKGKGPLKVRDDVMAALDMEEDLARHAASVRR